jgi:hypothetical protein
MYWARGTSNVSKSFCRRGTTGRVLGNWTRFPKMLEIHLNVIYFVPDIFDRFESKSIHWRLFLIWHFKIHNLETLDPGFFTILAFIFGRRSNMHRMRSSPHPHQILLIFSIHFQYFNSIYVHFFKLRSTAEQMLLILFQSTLFMPCHRIRYQGWVGNTLPRKPNLWIKKKSLLRFFVTFLSCNWYGNEAYKVESHFSEE